MEKSFSFRDRMRQLASKVGGLLLNALCTMGEAERHMYAYMPPPYEGLRDTTAGEVGDEGLISGFQEQSEDSSGEGDFLGGK
jgi:hypothetical protein